MTCIYLSCARPVAFVERLGVYSVGRCAVHESWLRALADDRYLTETPASPDQMQLQGALL